MAERRRPPRANAPFFMAGGDSDFYGPAADEDHSDGELFPSHSSHDIQHNSSGEQNLPPSSAADAYRSVDSTHQRYSMDLPPGATPPHSARPFLNPNAPTNFGPSGYTPSPSTSQRNSYRLSYTSPVAAGVPQALTPNGTARQFPPSAFVDPAAGMPLGPNGLPIPADSASSSSYHGHTVMRRASSDEMGGRNNFGAAQRNSSLTSFAPPPAPWMRTESWHESTISVGSSGVRNGTPGTPGTGTLTPRKRNAMASTLIKGPVEKPWLEKKDPWERTSWWITVGLFVVGIGAAAVLCFFGYREVPHLGNICLVMADNFDNLDTGTWTRDVELGGLRNGDFAMFTGDQKNSWTDGGKLYITPTLTEDEIGDQVFSGGTYRLSGCTSNNASACNARSGNGKVINPVQSARLTTQNSYNIQYGRVEIRARIPKGDWLHPQILMLPQDPQYDSGFYPVNGEIDILQARGNSPTYPKQGRNYVTSGLHWAPTHMPNMDQFFKTYGWRSMRQGDFSDDYHTYVLEWSPDFLWTYVDRRTARMIDLRFNKESFYQRGKFPPTVLNNTNVPVVLNNPWSGRGNSAPFDQAFYLVVGLGVGGTDGWFQDGQGGKMWYDGSTSAMADFANNKNSWYPSWSSDETKKSFAIDYVKMWKKC